MLQRGKNQLYFGKEIPKDPNTFFANYGENNVKRKKAYCYFILSKIIKRYCKHFCLSFHFKVFEDFSIRVKTTNKKSQVLVLFIPILIRLLVILV